MTLYRALANLELKHEIIAQGSLFPGSLIAEQNLEILEARGKVSKVAAPPIGIMPGWKKRAEKLKTHHVEMVDELLDLDTAELAKIFKVKPETAAGWKAELRAYLEAPQRSG